MAALKRFHQLREPVKVGPWLRTAVRNRSLNMLRDRRRRIDAHARYAQDLHADGRSELKSPGPAAPPAEPPAPGNRRRLQAPLRRRTAAGGGGACHLGSTPAGVKQRLYRARHHPERGGPRHGPRTGRRPSRRLRRPRRRPPAEERAGGPPPHALRGGPGPLPGDPGPAAPGIRRPFWSGAAPMVPLESPGPDQIGALERAARAAPRLPRGARRAGAGLPPAGASRNGAGS